MAWTSPRTWVSGEVPTAAIFNTHVRDNLKAIGDAWTSYTPTWTSSGTAPAIGNGSLTGDYMRAGALVIFRIVLTMGGTTTYGTGTYSLSLPVAAATGIGRQVLTGGARDASATADYVIHGVITDASTTVSLRALPGTAGNALANMSPTVPFTWASSDVLTIGGTYEA